MPSLAGMNSLIYDEMVDDMTKIMLFDINNDNKRVVLTTVKYEKYRPDYSYSYYL